MSNQKEALWLLGACDAATQELTRKLAELPASIVDAEEKAQAAREVLDRERTTLEETERRRRSKEGELQDCEAQRQKFQSQTALVKTNIEYSALLHEIDGITARISTIEEEILLAMETIDEISARLEEVEIEQNRIEQDYLQQAGQLRKEMEESRQEIESKQKERDALLTTLGPETRKRYERVRQSQGAGTAFLHNQSCAACHRQIPPETVNRVLAGEVQCCGSCQRILVPGEV